MKNSKHQEATTLKQIRDELTIQAHLFGMEAKEEWSRLEHRFHELQAEVKSTLQADEITDRLVAAYQAFRATFLKKDIGKSPNAL